MTTLRFRATTSDCPIALISRIRQLTNLPIAEIRRRVAAAEHLIEISSFQKDWQEVRHTLVTIAEEMKSGKLPLSASEWYDGNEKQISNEMLVNLIAHFRHIELETQCDTMLELGEIDDPSQFSAYDEDWTKP